MDRFLSHPPLDGAIAALGARQNAVFHLVQLLDLGLTADMVRQRARAGRLHRIYRCVYSLVPNSLLTRKGRYMAAVLACGPGALLSHRSAAALHGLRQSDATKIDVTVPVRSHRRHGGLLIHRSTTLSAADVTVVDGIPCTSVARTLFDLSEVVPRRQTERAFDQAEVEGVLNLRAVQDVLGRNPTRRGARVIPAVLAEHYVGSTLTESELEEAMLELSRAAHLPPPEINKWIDLHDGEPMIRADFVWPAQRLIVEVDSRKYHGTRQRFESDRRRDQRAMVAGWRVIRTTDNQIRHRPGELHATVVKLLAQATPAAVGSPAAGAVPAPRRR